MPSDFERAERQEVRYLPVMATRLVEGDDSLLEFSVHCPRRGKTCLADCMECSHAGQLRHHGRRGPLVLECTLERHWRGGRC
jgi:hypothetical protein